MSPLPKRKFIDYSGIFLQRPHLLHEQLQFLCIKRINLQGVYEISSEMEEALQIVNAIDVH